MRNGYHQSIFRDQDKVVAINLGADYCSEHEWGIAGIKEIFGIKEKGDGISKRTIKPPSSKYVNFIDNKDKTVLLIGASYYKEEKDLRTYNLERSKYQEDKLLTAWDGRSFGINAQSESDREVLREIYAAMLDGDLAIWLGGGGVFQNAGLVLAIVSRIPEKMKVEMKEKDLDAKKLEKAADATCIKNKLEKAGRRFFSLSPKWMKGFNPQNRNPKSKHPVIFWLNPHDQQNNHSGWYTVEELELWAENKGPIVKESEKDT